MLFPPHYLWIQIYSKELYVNLVNLFPNVSNIFGYIWVYSDSAVYTSKLHKAFLVCFASFSFAHSLAAAEGRCHRQGGLHVGENQCLCFCVSVSVSASLISGSFGFLQIVLGSVGLCCHTGSGPCWASVDCQWYCWASLKSSPPCLTLFFSDSWLEIGSIELAKVATLLEVLGFSGLTMILLIFPHGSARIPWF